VSDEPTYAAPSMPLNYASGADEFPTPAIRSFSKILIVDCALTAVGILCDFYLMFGPLRAQYWPHIDSISIAMISVLLGVNALGIWAGTLVLNRHRSAKLVVKLWAWAALGDALLDRSIRFAVGPTIRNGTTFYAQFASTVHSEAYFWIGAATLPALAMILLKRKST
jgi:hypothetical protein